MCDSQLVVKQVIGVFAEKDECMAAYQQLVNCMSQGITTISYHHIPREENRGADALASVRSKTHANCNRKCTDRSSNKVDCESEYRPTENKCLYVITTTNEELLCLEIEFK